MAEGLSWNQVSDPAYLFAAGAPFLETFGRDTNAGLIDPHTHPLQFAEEAARLNPRHPKSVFRKPDDSETVYQDRYAMADNGLPAWAAPYESVINDTAHALGVRDKEIGATFAHPFSPQGEFDLGLVLEGANNASKNRAFAMADAIRRGDIAVKHMAVVGTGRTVGPREGHGDIALGFGVADKVVRELREEYGDLFAATAMVPLEALHIRTKNANTREVVAEAALRLGIGSVVMSGSNIYGTWMRTDMATVQRSMTGLDRVGYGAGPDDPKAARTPLIWAAEVAQSLVSAAHLQHAYNTKN